MSDRNTGFEQDVLRQLKSQGLDETADIERLEAAVRREVDKATDLVWQRTRRQARWLLAESRGERARFEARLLGFWGTALDGFELLLVSSVDVGTSHVQVFGKGSPTADERVLFDALQRFHRRACLVASEVFSLLSAGHAGGALARWRTLHEIAVTAAFVKEHGAALAERFLLHDVVERLETAEAFGRHATKLGERPPTAAELDALRTEVGKLTARFGPEFGNRYGWAAEVLRKKRPLMKDIEAAADLGHWEPYIKLASVTVHAVPRGAFWDPGVPTYSPSGLAGPSNYGLDVPGVYSILSLQLANWLFVSSPPDADGLAKLYAINRLADRTAEAFARAAQHIDARELGPSRKGGRAKRSAAGRAKSRVAMRSNENTPNE